MSSGTILLTGGAGYIGSFIARSLRESGRPHVVLDDLSEGKAAAARGSVIETIDLRDRESLSEVLVRHRVEWIIHMAAHSIVCESMTAPEKYWRNNVVGSLTLIEEARRARVSGMVFSSTAAVYGEPESVPIDEKQPCVPTNFYGETKIAIERVLAACHAAYGLRSISLRYFNAAGATPDGSMGESHSKETHLIPLVLGAALGTRPPVTVLGTDYPTPDGTGVRDYIHVEDLADAHVLALDALSAESTGAENFNLGGGAGRSVREVLDVSERITGRRIPRTEGARRAGDPAVLIASSAKARERLGWVPRRSDLATIVETAWKWHRDHPCGHE